MTQISITGVICEDIRTEKSGQETLIGIFPDNVNVPAFPCIMPKVAIYLRIHVDPAFDPGSIKTRILMPDGEEQDLGELSQEFIATARYQALENGTPIAGMISRATISPLHLAAQGRLTVLVSVQGKEFPCAALNFIEQPPKSATSSNEPAPPS